MSEKTALHTACAASARLRLGGGRSGLGASGDWIIHTAAGPGATGDGGPATEAQLKYPEGVAADAAGNVYIADYGNARIRKIDAATGAISTIAGTGMRGYSGDGGPAAAAQIGQSASAAPDADGNLYIADLENSRIRKIDAATGAISTFAGTGILGFSGDGGPATAAQILQARSVAADAAGNVYIADGTWRVRKVDAATGVISTFAGTGAAGSGGDGGPATAAQLSGPLDVAADSAGNIYIADRNAHRIRKVDAATGVISTFAGTGAAGSGGDGGAATAAQLNRPWSVAADTDGNVYIADRSNHRIRKVDASTGVISTIAGTGTLGFSGDGGPATAARLRSPSGVAKDADGNVYIADRSNHRIRKVDASTGVISTIAGTGAIGDGGWAAAAQLYYPWGTALDAAGNLYIADSWRSVVRRVDAAAGTISTVAGTGASGFSGDGGPATAAQPLGSDGGRQRQCLHRRSLQQPHPQSRCGGHDLNYRRNRRGGLWRQPRRN